jgi:hypothetical protein
MPGNRAAFFFGSGISRDSGAAMVDAFTDSLLHRGWEAHTDLRFYPSTVPSTGEAGRAQEFIRILATHINPHLQHHEGRDANYEDIYAAALQIVWDETAEIINPLIAESVALIRNATEPLFRNQQPHIDRNAFASLVDRATDLVQWTVFHDLSKATKPIGMEAISAVAKQTDELDIFSLNHDLLIERELDRNGIKFADGFGAPWGNDVLRFNWSWNAAGTKVRLYKLHGSLNWYFFRTKLFDQFGKVKGDPEHCKDENGKRLSLLQPQPRFLTGTTVKEQSYGSGLTGEFFTEFRSRLAAHETLICCGYGWGDKGINIRLNQWLRDNVKNKIVILHKGSADEIRQKRFWFFRWDEYERAGKVLVFPHWLSECTVQDLEPFFG